MKVTINIGGVDVTFEVSNTREALNLAAEVAKQNRQQCAAVAVADQQEAEVVVVERDDVQPIPLEDVSDDEVYKALLYMSGNPSAKLLIELTKHERGCTDTVLKEAMNLPKIAAVMSHVTKCCKKAGIPKSAIYVKRSKRLARGVVRYHYQVTDQAKRVITGFPDFEEGAAFPDDIDPFLT